MSIVYRKAKPRDIELLAQTRLKLLEEGSGVLSKKENSELYQNIKEYITKAMKNGTFFAYLAFDGGSLAGTCAVNLYCVLPGKKLPNGKNAYLQNMYVMPSYRRKGIAEKLVNLSVDEAKAKGHNRIELHATEAGKCLFGKCGFASEKSMLSNMVYN